MNTQDRFILGDNIGVDISTLMETRLLIQANSGGGKSWTIRRILEQTHGKVQQIVLDVEDEFGTLREKFDYVLASPEGDCAVTVQSSALLARRLLEHNVSAIVNLHELQAHERPIFVRRFLDSMISAPKTLWHPVMVVIDEAHYFAPQKGSSEASSAVIDLMTRGRKRGYCGVLATQRISKLHKDAAAEANNKLIGRSTLDVDIKRSSDELGFVKERHEELRTLHAGEFFCFGPAISDTVKKVNVGEVLTAHPKIGAMRANPQPPSKKVRAILAKLGDIPQAAAEEIRDMVAAQKRIRELERELRAKPVLVKAPDADVPNLRRRIMDAERKLTAQGKNAARLRMRVSKVCDGIQAAVKALSDAVTESNNEAGLIENQILPMVAPGVAIKLSRPTAIKMPTHPVFITRESKAGVDLKGGALRMLQVLVQHHPAKLTKSQWGTLAKMRHTGGSFGTYLSKLNTAGYCAKDGDIYFATDAGLDAIGQEYEAAPAPGPELVEYWASKFGGRPAQMLREVADAYPDSLTKEMLGNAVEMTASGGSFATYLSKLTSNKLVTVERGSSEIRLAAWLMESEI